MTLVKSLYDQTLRLDDYEPKHVGYLLDRMTRRMRHDLTAIPGARERLEAHKPLTSSYFRLLSMIPAEGATITDLAVPAAMTKQALGQFVDVLVEHGYVTQERSDADGRVRIVRRTARADGLVAELNEMYEELDRRWAAVLGPERFAVLREAMVALATGWDGTG